MQLTKAINALSAIFALSLIAVPLSGCGDTAVAYSELVSLKLSGIKDGDVENGMASEEKNVNSESGNPYGDFIKNAKAALGDAEPSRVEMTSALAGIHSDSKGIIRLDQVFSRLELFITSSTGTYVMGETKELASSTVTIAINEDIDWEVLLPIFWQGDFKVGVRGDILPTTPKSWDLKLFLDLTFEAFE